MARGNVYKTRWENVQGRIIRIPGTVGIAWYVPYRSIPPVPDNRIDLIALPNGTTSTLFWNSLRFWLERGTDMVVYGERTYPTWQDAALAIYPRDVAERLGSSFVVVR